MRPVEKAQPNDVLKTRDGDFIVKAKYNPHTSARKLLEANIGDYCSYCEVFSSDLEVEHIISQDQNDNKKYDWDNFVIACGTCNGSANKSNKPVDLSGMYFPHLNNTLLTFNYLEGGVVVENPTLTDAQKVKAEAMLDLVGLDKYLGNPKYPKVDRTNDTRWKNRRRAWELANKYLIELEAKKKIAEDIVEFAKERGFFSVWFTVFQDHKEVRKALIEAFSGTHRASFDADFNPIPRNSNDL